MNEEANETQKESINKTKSQFLERMNDIDKMLISDQKGKPLRMQKVT